MAKINLEAFKLKNIQYKLIDDKIDNTDAIKLEDLDTSNIELQLNSGETAYNEETNAGRLTLILSVIENHPAYDRFIDLEIEGYFKYDTNIMELSEDEFNEYQGLLQINGTAIILPYIRSYVSNLTAFDNVTQHLLIPTVNVYDLYKEMGDKDK